MKDCFPVVLRIAILIMAIFAGDVMLAQGPPPPPPPPGGGVPVDGGLALLLLAGAAYGAKKIYDNKKNVEEI